MQNVQPPSSVTGRGSGRKLTEGLLRIIGEGPVSNTLLTLATVNLLSIPMAAGYTFSLGPVEISNPSGRSSVLLVIGLLAYRFAWRRRETMQPGLLWKLVCGYKTAIALSAIVAVGLGLRLWGLEYGFPLITDPDEPETVGRAVGMLRRGSLDPRWYIYPTFYMNLLLPAFGVWYIAGRGRGLWESLEDVSLTDPGFYLIGRYYSVLFGTLTILLAYFLARQVWPSRDGQRAGPISAPPWSLSRSTT